VSVDQLAQAVRQQLGIGRVLPLGGPRDGAWITEQAASGVLRAAVGEPGGMRLGALRLTTDESGEPGRPAADAGPPSLPPPPSALPPGPLRITADFAALADRPLPDAAERLRGTLLTAAEAELGLRVSAADLRVSGLLTEGAAAGGGPAANGAGATAAGRVGAGPAAARPDASDPIAAAALAVPGVARLAPVLGGGSRPVRLTDGHALIQLATLAGRRALDVALAVRAAARSVARPPETVAVLVTAVEHG
jgi:hypothetical protein